MAIAAVTLAPLPHTSSFKDITFLILLFRTSYSVQSWMPERKLAASTTKVGPSFS